VRNISERPAESEALGGVGVKKAGKLGCRGKFRVGAENCKWRHYCEWPEEGNSK